MAKENVNTTQCNPGEDRFGDDLRKFINQLESVRKIKRISESENYIIKKLEDELTQRKNKINELTDKIAELEQDLKSTRNQPVEENSEKDNKKDYSLPTWIIIGGVITFWAFIAFFAYCSLQLLSAAVCACVPQKLIPLLISGILVLMIMAVIVIVTGAQAKHVLTREKECS